MVLYVCVEIETAVVVVLGVHATVFPSVCTATCFGQHVQRKATIVIIKYPTTLSHTGNT